MNTPAVHSHIPEQAFRALGLRDVAYVRPTSVGEGAARHTIFSIHAADGTAVGAAETRDLAFSAVRENGLEALSVH